MGYNRRELNEAVYIIKYSLLHTLAAKHRMSLKQVIKKYTVDKVNHKLGVKLDNGKRVIIFDEPKSLSASYLDKKYS
jgi:1,2-phenylacetyl-CoA epoxidase PaaB subunit